MELTPTQYVFTSSRRPPVAPAEVYDIQVARDTHTHTPPPHVPAYTVLDQVYN